MMQEQTLAEFIQQHKQRIGEMPIPVDSYKLYVGELTSSQITTMELGMVKTLLINSLLIIEKLEKGC